LFILADIMETEQRIKELRTMFLQLMEITVGEIKEGKPVHTTETFEVMKRIHAELQQLEAQKGINSD